MENPNKSKENPNNKESTSFSFESQLGECENFWLIRGPPFDQRDYMISPSETVSVTPREKIPEPVVKRKLRPSDITFDNKHLLDSQRALKKILELINDGCAEQLVDRLEELINFFLQGAPLGFFMDDLPTIIEIVEFFSRNRSSVLKFGDFVKSIMYYASEPPKVNKVSEMLKSKDVLTDYFTLFAELLASFDDECFQLHLLEALDCLIIRRKLVDVCCVKLPFCHEAMEKSQLPCVVSAMLETVPSNLYIHYLELALQIIWVSVKAGYVMAQSNIVEYIIRRMDPTSLGNPTNFSMEALEQESELHEYYTILDKSAYLIWGLFAIASKYDVKIPTPKEDALWSLKYVFHREAKKKLQKAVDTRNNIIAILAKLFAVFGEELPIRQTGLVGDIAALSVSTEIKTDFVCLTDIILGTNNEDYVLKKLLLLCCCLFARTQDLLFELKHYQVIEGVLRLINPKTTLPWIPSQYLNLLFVGLRTLSELVPKLPETYLSCNGNARLLSTIKWLAEEYFDQDSLLEVLKTFCTIIICDNESLIKDAKAQDSVRVLLDVCFRLLDVTYMKLEHQEKLSRIFVILERLFKNDRAVQAANGDSCVSISVKLFQRILADSENDSKWNSNLLVSFGGFLWEAVAWCSSTLGSFIEKSGIFLLLDFLETSSFPVQLLFLGVLVDMTDEGETIAHLLTWRGKKGYGILSLLIDIWRKEEFLTKVHRTREGIIVDVEAPLMTEEQWYLSNQVEGGHIYSPSITEMVCSVRPKVHALYQFLQRRYFELTQIGESNYGLQLKMIEPSHVVYIPLIEHFLALKMGEVWGEVIQDAMISGVLPSTFDGQLICTLLDEKNQWAARIKTMQEEIILMNKGGTAGAERELYKCLKLSRLPFALEALHDLDYIARSSFRKFQKQKKNKQIVEIQKFLENSKVLTDDTYHRTFLNNTNTTFMNGVNIWIQSEKTTVPTEEFELVSPESGGSIRFNNADKF